MSDNSEGNSEGALDSGAPSSAANSNSSDNNDLRDWGGWTRTTNRRINSAMLCQLSYTPSTRIPAATVGPGFANVAR
jgi:hypothetical protein